MNLHLVEQTHRVFARRAFQGRISTIVVDVSLIRTLIKIHSFKRLVRGVYGCFRSDGE